VTGEIAFQATIFLSSPGSHVYACRKFFPGTPNNLVWGPATSASSRTYEVKRESTAAEVSLKVV
jgi:hypothetical protein